MLPLDVVWMQEERLRLVHSDVLRADMEQLLSEMLAQPRDAAAPCVGDAPSASSSSSVDSSSSSGDGDASSAGPATAAATEVRHSAAPGQPKGSKSGRQRKVKVVANLPYNITKEFLVKMMPLGDLVSELSIMIQVLLASTWTTVCLPHIFCAFCAFCLCYVERTM